MTSQAGDTKTHLSDEEAIRQTALDYVEGWYQADAERMRRCLHPSLVKRALKKDSPTGRRYLNYLTREEMVVATEDGGGTHVAIDQQVYTVTLLDVCGEIASVRADSPDWVDYLHVVKLDGGWVIANVLYTHNPNKFGANGA
jgi:hypothetical protein